MITECTRISCSDTCLTLMGADPEQSVFFDIETTGFKADYSHVYLIGAAYQSGTDWVIRQWMSERPQEESGLLRIFSQFLRPRRTVIHFNGNHFDIPYLEDKYKQYGLDSPFTKIQSVDIYQDIRGMKKLLGLSHMNQKSLEQFLRICREDIYDGGRLIRVYHDFCRTGDSDLERLLLLHNKEDVEGMLSLTKLYAYPAALASLTGKDDVLLSDASVSHASALSEETQTDLCLQIRFPLPCSVPVPVCYEQAPAVLSLTENSGILRTPLLKGTLRYFFEDYKEYYYLPQEDQAIHKSVAVYVDKAYRRQATAKTCYVRQEGVFLPQPETHFTPALKRDYKDALTWIKIPEELMPSRNFADLPAESISFLQEYACLWLSSLVRACMPCAR